MLPPWLTSEGIRITVRVKGIWTGKYVRRTPMSEVMTRSIADTRICRPVQRLYLMPSQVSELGVDVSWPGCHRMALAAMTYICYIDAE